jgi:large subunit ribosomal protein L17
MHRHQYKGRKFSRDIGQRKALLRSLATSVVLYEKVKTTLPKAKEIRPIVEKLITTAKSGDLAAIRQINSYLLDEKAVQKLVTEIAPLYKERNGGYTRITKVTNRMGDNASMAIIELLDTEKLVKPVAEKKAKSGDVKETEEKQKATKAKPKKTTAKTKESK